MSTMFSTSYADRKGERGNVLFLILIAVVLFAALSYAVTQSSRSGSGDAGKETNLINSAQITQYPASVKTAIIRMTINGVTDSELKFNAPSDFGALTNPAQGVFHPSGGGAVYASAPADVMASGSQGTWYFNPNFEVVNIGTNSTGAAAGNEFIAFLPGLKSAICQKINEEVGIGSTIPVATNDVAVKYADLYDDTKSDTIPADVANTVLGTAAGTTALVGQAYGCFRNTSSGDYVYYHVLVER